MFGHFSTLWNKGLKVEVSVGQTVKTQERYPEKLLMSNRGSKLTSHYPIKMYALFMV